MWHVPYYQKNDFLPECELWPTPCDCDLHPNFDHDMSYTADYDLDAADYLYPDADCDLHLNWVIDLHNIYHFP